MGIFDGLQRWQRRRKALGLLEAGELEAATRLIGPDTALRHELAESLLEQGKLELSRALLGHEGTSTLGALLRATPIDVELERTKREAAAPALPDDAHVLELAAALTAGGASDEARALLDRAAHERRSWPLLRRAIEAWLEAGDAAHAWPLVEAGFAQRRQLEDTTEAEVLLDLHRRVLTALKGPEAVRVDLLMRGAVDPFVDDGYLELAAALMREGPPLTTRLSLVTASQELREGDERLRGDRKSATGLLRVGSAKLRLGELADAREAFEQARAVAPRHFGVVLGLGAVITAQRTDALTQVRALPDLAPLPGLEAVVPDLEALTNLELRVVQACARPLAPWFGALRERGLSLTLLPLDARASDLPDFEQRRADAERRGLPPGRGLGVVRVESLFDLRPTGRAFERELEDLVARVR